MAALDSNQEAARMWEKVRQEKAAGCYPWTHLTHNEEEEVWINPLSLPQDLSREAILRKDGTIPSEWFHLPEGAAAPTVEEMLREDSPELEEVKEEEVGVELGVEEELERELERRRRTPSGRRTPLCGRHRHRHKSGKSSTGSSPAPSHRNELRQASSPVPPPPTFDDGGYEPVGQPHSDRPETRSPQSRLPTLPSGDETDTATQSCFPLRKTRSRSKDKKQKKSSRAEDRSQSLDSLCSEHNYETPKLLQRSPKASPPQVDRKKKPESQGKRSGSDPEDGYEPVGKAPLNMETWIAEKNNEFNATMVSDADTRNINKKAVKESKVATVPHVNLEVVAGGNKNNEMENVELVHLQRSLSEKSFKSNSSEKKISKREKENQGGGKRKREISQTGGKKTKKGREKNGGNSKG